MAYWLCQAALNVEVTDSTSSRQDPLRRTVGSSFSQYFRPFLGYRYRVFGVGAGLPVEGNHGPAVCQNLCVVGPQIYHWFHRKYVAGSDLRTLPWLAIIGNLRVLMHASPNTMSDIIADH